MDSNAVVNSSSQQISRYRLIRPFLTLKTFRVLVFWSFGLFAVFLSPAPMTVTPEMQQRFEKKLSIANELETKALSASDHAYSLTAYTNSAKVWFWRFRPEHRYPFIFILRQFSSKLLERLLEKDRELRGKLGRKRRKEDRNMLMQYLQLSLN